jgi:branched-chain amino acid transport system substrate-binding protein
MKRIVTFIALISLAAVPALAAEPIRIGAFFALSGPASHIGTPTKLVAQMVVDKINKEGGIQGRPLELVIGDTESDPAKAATIAKKFIYSDKVVAIVGPTSTGEGMQSKKVVEEAGIPTVMTVGGDPVIMGGNFGPFTYVFKSPQRSAIAARRLLAYLKEKKIAKAGLVFASDSFGKDGAGLIEKLAPEYGVTLVATESFGPSDTDMTAQLVKVRKAGAQAVICWTIGPAGAIVAKNRVQIGMEIPLFQCHGQPDPVYVQLAGKASEGNIMPSTKLMVWETLPDSDPQKKVIADFVRLYRDGYKFEKEFPINTHSGYAWDAIMIIANALRKAGTEPKALRQAIEETKGYVGISGIYSLTAEDHNGLGVDSLVMVQVKGGKFVPAE